MKHCVAFFCSYLLLNFGSAAGALSKALGNATANLAVGSSSEETTAYSYTGGAGVITMIFVESADFLWPSYDALRLRVYVDEESQNQSQKQGNGNQSIGIGAGAVAVPAVDVPMGFFDQGDISPWGQLSLGNTGSAGAEYLNFPIPFASSVRVAFVLGAGDLGPHHINVVVRARGITSGTPTTRTQTQCPPTATFSAGETVALFNSSLIDPAPAGVAPGGQLSLIGLSLASANNESYLSGPLTLCADGECALVSYGVESFFLAEQGLGMPKYTNPHAGVTAIAPILGHSALLWRDLTVASDGFFGEQLTLLWSIPPDAGQVSVSVCSWVRLGVSPPIV
jgi:hypothetical protein